MTDQLGLRVGQFWKARKRERRMGETGYVASPCNIGDFKKFMAN